MIPSITCRHCGAVDNYRTEPAGPHVKAVCAYCNRYIKFLPQPGLPDELDSVRIHFGQHTGTLISEINNTYLQWVLNTIQKLPTKTRQAIERKLSLILKS